METIKERLKKLSAYQIEKYRRFYGIVVYMNRKSHELFPLEDDIDNILLIKNFLIDKIDTPENALYVELLKMIENYEIAESQVMDNIILHDGHFYERIS